MASGTQDTGVERIGASDPWAFQRWAFKQKTGTAARKAVLSMLATMVDVVAGRCEVKQATIAQGTEISERRVRDHLAELERRGLIARRSQFRRDGRRRGDEFLLLAPWITEWPDGELVERVAPPDDLTTGRFDRRSPASGHNRTPVSGQELPPVEQPLLGDDDDVGEMPRAERANTASSSIPSPELEGIVDAVERVLTATAKRLECSPPRRSEIAATVSARPRAPHVATAFDVAIRGENIGRIVGVWRAWLEQTDDVDDLERIGDVERRLDELDRRRRRESHRGADWWRACYDGNGRAIGGNVIGGE